MFSWIASSNKPVNPFDFLNSVDYFKEFQFFSIVFPNIPNTSLYLKTEITKYILQVNEFIHHVMLH